MRITVDYESCWRNSFLDGSNNEPTPKRGRKFVASMTSLKGDSGNFMPREITHDTVMGVLYRLIGDQRKLFQARQDSDRFFDEGLVSFTDTPKQKSDEVVFLRSTMGSYDPNSFSGALKADHPMFTSDCSHALWSTLWLDWENLCLFIRDEKHQPAKAMLDPLSICARFDEIKKMKPLPNEGENGRALSALQSRFAGQDYLKNGKINPTAFYCSALYLRLERLADKHDTAEILTKNGKLSGVSKRTFTKKSFLGPLATGGQKPIHGNPYIHKEYLKGEGEVTRTLTKASGRLEITINVDRGKAKEIRAMIECAGVSAFPLGKKGLAYVSAIRV